MVKFDTFGRSVTAGVSLLTLSKDISLSILYNRSATFSLRDEFKANFRKLSKMETRAPGRIPIYELTT